MKIDANDIRVGNVLEHNKKLWVVLKTQHTQPGKGGAYMQVEMKEIKEGTKSNTRFRSSESVEKVRIDAKEYQYLYEDGDKLELMDNESYEQISVNKELLGEQAPFLQDGMSVTLESYNGEHIALLLPELVTVAVMECEPVVKGQTAASSNKPAVLENGVRLMVPPFINVGDKIVVKLETMEYQERAK